MLAMRPAPIPDVFVGVLTETKMISASSMCLLIFVEKKRLILPEKEMSTSEHQRGAIKFAKARQHRDTYGTS